MSCPALPHTVPSGWSANAPWTSGWENWDPIITSTVTSTATTTPTTIPPGISSTGSPAPSTSQVPIPASVGTAHQNVILKIVIPVCLVTVGLAITFAIIWFRCSRKQSRVSNTPESVNPYPIDMEQGVAGIGTQKGNHGYATAGVTRFSAPSTHQPDPTTEVPSQREQQLGNQLTAVIQKLEALETAVQTSTTTTGHQSSSRTSILDEQPPDYMAIHSIGGSVEVEAGPIRDRKVEHQ